MSNKPFEIQSPTISLNGVAIDTSAQGKLVIPGITRAGTSVAIEVNDTADQTTTWPDIPTVIDGYQYAVLNGDLTAQVGWTTATYVVDQIDGEGYIDGITVSDGGAGYTGEAVTYSQVMYATLAVDPINNFNANDWTQIPFAVRCGAGEIQSEFGGGGSGLVQRTVNYPLGESGDTAGTIALDPYGNVYVCTADFVEFQQDEFTVFNTTANIGQPSPPAGYQALTIDFSDERNADFADFMNNPPYDYNSQVELSFDGGDTFNVTTYGYSPNAPVYWFFSFNGTALNDGDEVVVRISSIVRNIWTQSNISQLVANNQQINSVQDLAGGESVAYFGNDNLDLYVQNNTDHSWAEVWMHNSDTSAPHVDIAVRAAAPSWGSDGLQTWSFKHDGTITFPNGTVQTTAYAGGVNSGYMLQVGDINNLDTSFTVVTIDGDGNTYYCGATTGNSPGRSPIVVKVDSNGTVQWQATLEIEGEVTGAWYFNGLLRIIVQESPRNSPPGKAWNFNLNVNTSEIVYNFYLDTSSSNDVIQLHDTLLYEFNNSPSASASAGSVVIANAGPFSQALLYMEAGDPVYAAAVTDGSTDLVYYGLTNDPYSGDVWAVGRRGATYQTLITYYANNGGAVAWHKSIDLGRPDQQATSVAHDGHGHIYVVSNNADNGNDIFLTKMVDTTGEIVWQRGMGGSQTGDPMGAGDGCVTIDGAGNIITAWQFGSISSRIEDLLIVKFSPDGNVLWQRSLGTGNYEYTSINTSTEFLTSDADYYYIATTTNPGGPFQVGNAVQLPLDGSGTGGYGDWIYSTQNWTVLTIDVTSGSLDVTNDLTTSTYSTPTGSMSIGVNNNPLNVLSEFINKAVDTGNVTFDGNTISTRTGYPTIINSVGSSGGVEIDYQDGDGQIRHSVWLNGTDGLAIQVNSQDNSGVEAGWYFGPDGKLTFPDGTEQKTAYIGAPLLDFEAHNSASGGATSTITVTANPNTVIVLASGVETTDNSIVTITNITGLNRNWFQRTSYSDPNSTSGQTAELWYAINDTPDVLRGPVTITYSGNFDDETVTIGVFSNVDLANGPFIGEPVVSNYINGSGYAEATVSVDRGNTLGLVFFGVPSTSTPGLPDGWTNIAAINNSGADRWEYTQFSYKVFDTFTTEKVATPNQINGSEGSQGLTTIFDTLLGIAPKKPALFNDSNELSFPDGTKQTTAYSTLETSWVAIVGDGFNSHPHAEDYNTNRLWFDVTCPGPDGTVFAAGGWDYNPNPIVYQFDKNGKILWKWMDWQGRNTDSVSAMTYDDYSHQLLVAVPGATDGSSWGTLVYVFDKQVNQQVYASQAWSMNRVDMMADGNDDGQLTVRDIISYRGQYTVVGEKYGNFLPIVSGLTAGTGTTASKIVFPKSSIPPHNNRYPEPGNTWNLKATNSGGVQYDSTPNNSIGRFRVNFIDGITVNGTGSGAWIEIRVDYNNNNYNISDWNVNNDWLDGAIVTIPGSQLGGVDGTNDCTFTVRVWNGGPGGWWYWEPLVGTPDTTNIVVDILSWSGDFTDSTYTFDWTLGTEADAFIYSHWNEFHFIMEREGYGAYDKVLYDAHNQVYYASGYSNSSGDNGAITKFVYDNGWIVDWTLTNTGEVPSMALNTDGSRLFAFSYSNNVIFCVDTGTREKLWETKYSNFYNDDFNSLVFYKDYLYTAAPVYGAFINNTSVFFEKIDPSNGSTIWGRVVESERDNWQISDNYLGSPLTVTDTGLYYSGYAYFKTDDYRTASLVKIPLDGGVNYDYLGNRPPDVVNEFKISGSYDGQDLNNFRETSSYIELDTRVDLTANTDNDFNLSTTTFNTVSPMFNTSIDYLTHGYETDPTFVPQKNVGWTDNSHYTLQLSDAGKFIRNTWDAIDYGTDTYINVPTSAQVDFPIGTVITIINTVPWNSNSRSMYIQTYDSDDFGQIAYVYLAGEGPFPQNDGRSNQWRLKGRGTATLMKIGTDEWLLTGDCEDSDY